MDFVGTGNRLTAQDYADAARLVGVTASHIRAVVEVEAASYGFDAKNRPLILPEPHIFYRELGPGPTRDTAVAQGLAYAKWGARPYPRSMDARYANLDRMVAINETAALRSVSWGIGQVMGFNHRDAGFPTVQELVQAMLRGERDQLLAMIGFIRATGLADELKSENWVGFARGYNGAGYAKNAYDIKLRTAFAKHSGGVTEIEGMGDDARPLLELGMKGSWVNLAQQRLVLYGALPEKTADGRSNVDGDFGPTTKRAVTAFQGAHPETGLVDGRIGKKTWAVLLSDPTRVDPPQDDIVPPAPGSREEEPAKPVGQAVAAGGAVVLSGAALASSGLSWQLIVGIVVVIVAAGIILLVVLKRRPAVDV